MKNRTKQAFLPASSCFAVVPKPADSWAGGNEKIFTSGNERGEMTNHWETEGPIGAHSAFAAVVHVTHVKMLRVSVVTSSARAHRAPDRRNGERNGRKNERPACRSLHVMLGAFYEAGR